MVAGLVIVIIPVLELRWVVVGGVESLLGVEESVNVGEARRWVGRGRVHAYWENKDGNGHDAEGCHPSDGATAANRNATGRISVVLPFLFPSFCGIV